MSKCPYCGGEMNLEKASFIYHNKKSENWGYVWVCEHYPACDSYVGCHPNTTIPLGRPANARLRTLKKEAHKQFDPIWKSGLVSRREAYDWLAKMMNLPLEECHIGMFDIKQCQEVIHLCRKQDNPVINNYRHRNYGYSYHKPVFTRGYNNQKPHRD